MLRLYLSVCTVSNLKRDLPYDWDQVVAKFNGDRRFDLVRHHLQDPKTQNLGFLSAIGGTSKRRDTITGVVCMSYEIDEGLDLEGQKVAWKKANLPTPTIGVFTGNRSIHWSWVFRTPVGVAAAEFCRKRLSKAIEDANPGVQTDHNLHSAVQVQRLAGLCIRRPDAGLKSSTYHLTPMSWMRCCRPCLNWMNQLMMSLTAVVTSGQQMVLNLMTMSSFLTSQPCPRFN